MLNRLFQSTFVNGKHFLEKVDLKSSDGGKVNFEELKKKAVLVYFSAGWCNSCKQFTPKIKKFYEEAKSEGLEVVWVSRDRSEKDQMDYYKTSLPEWPYVPYGENIKHMLEAFQLKTIPMVKLVDFEGNVLDESARTKIEKSINGNPNPKDIVKEWKKSLNI